MTGAPHLAYASGEFISVRREAVIALGSWEAAGVWQRICWRTEKDQQPWVATVAEIAAECWLSRHKTRAALDAIRAAGWVSSTRATSMDRTLEWTPIWADDPSAEIRTYPGSTNVDPSAENRTYPVEQDFASTLFCKTAETTTPLSPPPPGPVTVDEQGTLPILAGVVAASPATIVPDPLTGEFAGFWKAYPRKVGKKAAERAYRSARKNATLDVIAAGLRGQLPDLLARERTYVPHPATWLNQQRFADDPAHAAQPRSGARNFDLEAVNAALAGTPVVVTDETAQQVMRMIGGGA